MPTRRTFIEALLAARGLPVPTSGNTRSRPSDVTSEHYSDVVERVDGATDEGVTVRPANAEVRMVGEDAFHDLLKECPIDELAYDATTWNCYHFALASALWFAARGVTQVGFVHDFDIFEEGGEQATHTYNIVVFPEGEAYDVAWLEPQTGFMSAGTGGPREGLVYV